MPTRREVLAGAGAGAATLALSGCAGGADVDEYQDAVGSTWAALSEQPDMREFVRYATLAANSHNTQPWRFRLDRDAAAILPDFTRRTPVVDPDDHHLYCSLGCAAENFSVTAAARGRHATTGFDATEDGAVTIALDQGAAEPSDLAAAIPARQSTRSDYDGRLVPPEHLALLEKAGRTYGADVMMVTERPKVEQVLDYVIAGNTAQMDDPAFVRELKQWLRFNADQALRTRDGLFSAASGNPSLPGWVASAIFRFVFTTRGENGRYASQIRSSAGIAIFTSESSDRAAWVNAGRGVQRFLLQATALGIRTAFVNQPVEMGSASIAMRLWYPRRGCRIPDRFRARTRNARSASASAAEMPPSN